MKRLAQNLHYSLRRLTRDPGSATVLLITAALGLGPAVTVFSVLAGVLLKPLPFAQPTQLIQISETNLHFEGGQPVAASALNLAHWGERKNVFQDVAGVRLAYANLSGVGEPEEVEAPQVTSGFFSVLGVPPLLGRTFSPEDEAPEGAARVAVISHRLWQGRFGGDGGVIGRTIRLDGRAVEIVGVAPAGFRYPGSAEIWEPRRIDGNDPLRGLRIFLAVARLRDGASREAAQADLSALSRSLENEYPAENRGWSARLRPLGESEIAGIRPRLAVLSAAALLTLLIAGANAANLLLARLASRKRELAVRTSVGATRSQILAQLLTESVVLFGLGGALGLLLGQGALKILLAIHPESVPRSQEIGLDGRVLLFALLLSVGTGLLVGCLPAWAGVGRRLSEALKHGAKAVPYARAARAREVLGGLQIALALVLLLAASVLLVSFVRLEQQEPGFRSEGILTFRLRWPAARSMEEVVRRRDFTRQLLARIKAMPATDEAGLTTLLPVSPGVSPAALWVEGRPPVPMDQAQAADLRLVSPGYLRVLGIPLLQGRDLSEQDASGTGLVALVNRALARRLWPGEDPIGRRISLQPPGPQAAYFEVVGVVPDARNRTLAEEPREEIYLALAQVPANQISVLVRSQGNAPRSLATDLRHIVHALDPDLPLAEIRTLDEVISRSLAERRFQLLLVALLALVAFLLASVGVYGVVSYGVAQRTQEIGVRMALGAKREEIRRQVVWQGMLTVFLALATGLLGSMALARLALRHPLLQDQLYDPGSGDGILFLLVPAMLGWTAWIAHRIPAGRATRVSPLEALRAE